MNRITVREQIKAPRNFTISSPLYHVILVKQHMNFMANLIPYSVERSVCIFLSPYQKFVTLEPSEISILAFHGDFYCIEYHKKEVACNGILFNNIFSAPYIKLNPTLRQEIQELFQKINSLKERTEAFEESLIKAYLQVLLALSSKEKQKSSPLESSEVISPYANFNEIVEKFYIKERSLGFYANYYQTTSGNLSKKIKILYGKPPSVIIRERLILEAKKFLHLTHKNISEIAYELNFEDEFYFSKYFKKEVGVSPKLYRQKVGISIVAK